MIENWRDLVGYEEIQAPVGKVHYMKMTSNSDNGVSRLTMQIMKYEVECTLTEEELCDELDRILTSFSNTCENNADAIKKACLVSISKQKRGSPNTSYKNSQYYKGPSSYDSPVVVGGFEGKFGIFKHPDFDGYGFMIQDKTNEI
jgi:hypothetical protein